MSGAAARGRLPITIGVAAIALAVMVAWLAKIARTGAADQRPFLQKPKTIVTDVKTVEDLVEVAGPSVKKAFMKGLRERDWALAESALAPDFRGRFPAPGDGAAVPDEGTTLREYRADGLPMLDRAKFLEVMRAHVQDWAIVERTTWRMFEFLLAPDGRSVFASVHFQVAGRRPQGGRADLSGTVQAQLVSADGKAWKIRELGWVEGYRAETAAEGFADVTDLVGLTLNESEERRRLWQETLNDRLDATRGGLTVADFNRDGFPDVLATVANNEVVLFQNDGKGGFVRTPGPSSDPKEAPYFFLYADLDNDGVEELVSSRVTYDGNRACARLFRRNGELWQPVPGALAWEVLPQERDHTVQWIVPCDLDRNGFLDLYVCIYGDRNSKGPRHNFIAAYDGARNLLFMNHGGLKFTEEGLARGLTSTQYTYVAQWWDFDEDGDVDLWEGNDYGPNHLWENKGDGTFRDAAASVFNADSSYTMGVTIADWDNTGRWAMNISNMYSHAGNRIIPLVADLNPDLRRIAMVLAQGNQFYERDPQTGAWSESSVARGVNWADWAWSTLFFDPDNDGDRELFVANGFTSHENRDAPDY